MHLLNYKPNNVTFVSCRHRWLHYIGDTTPTTNPPKKHKWLIDHKENQTS